MNELTESWHAVARTILKRDEGVASQPYKDSLGYWTIGVGHFIGEELEQIQLNKGAIDALLDDDIAVAWLAVLNIFGAEFVQSLVPARQHALLNLAFNLGETRLRRFTKAIAAMQRGEWENAAAHFKDSLWAKQVKTRSDRVCFMILTGEYHDSYRL